MSPEDAPVNSNINRDGTRPSWRVRVLLCGHCCHEARRLCDEIRPPRVKLCSLDVIWLRREPMSSWKQRHNGRYWIS